MKFSDLAKSPYFVDSGKTFEENARKLYTVKPGFIVEIFDYPVPVLHIEIDESLDGKEISPWVTLTDDQEYILPINFQVKVFEVKFLGYL